MLETGFFSVGKQFIIPVTLFIGTALKAVFPFMVTLANENESEFKKKVSQGLFYISFNSIILFFLASIVGPWLITVFFGAEYKNSIEAFKLLVWGGIIVGLDNFIANILSATNSQKILAKLATLDFVIGLPIIYIGSFFNAEGIAMAILFFHLLIYVIHWFVLIRNMSLNVRMIDIGVLIFFLNHFYLCK